MNIVNIMNFARSFEPRDLELEKKLPDTTINQMKLVKELGVPATFLLQYDVLCNEEFISRIKAECTPDIELGFWYEVVEPLTTACGIPYESEHGWKWDWHIKPGFSMAYPNHERELLIDEAMRKFREVFGYYPRTVGSWLLDTHTVNYLCDNYEIDALCICRDQVNTDAYTMIGGYFNQAYYPSKNNIFTPASSESTQTNVPVFRLLGPDPIHNYDNEKFAGSAIEHGPYTMEVALLKTGGGNPEIVDWYLKNYFDNESLGFAYMQIGQENSFCMFDVCNLLKMQIEKIKKLKHVKIEKMGDTGKAFKEKYASTPATALCALDNWDTEDVQSIYYDSKHYTANVVRHGNKVFIRSLYLFDDSVEDAYNNALCDTFDAVYENLPIVDTIYQKGDTDGGYGMILDSEAESLKTSSNVDSTLEVCWNNNSIVFAEDCILIRKCKIEFTPMMINTVISVRDNYIDFEYKSHKYSLGIIDGKVYSKNNTIFIEGENVTLCPSKNTRIKKN